MADRRLIKIFQCILTNFFWIQDIESNEQPQETLVLLKVLALGSGLIEEGKTQSASKVFDTLRNRQNSLMA